MKSFVDTQAQIRHTRGVECEASHSSRRVDRICKTSVLAFPYTGSPAHAVDALDFRGRSLVLRKDQRILVFLVLNPSGSAPWLRKKRGKSGSAGFCHASFCVLAVPLHWQCFYKAVSVPSAYSGERLRSITLLASELSEALKALGNQGLDIKLHHVW